VKAADVPGRLSEAAGEELRALAAKVPADQLIVEIGAYLGRSTCFLAEGSRAGQRAQVASVDAWDLDGNTTGPDANPGMYVEPDNYSRYLTHVEACGVRGLVTPVQAFSSEAEIPDTPIGLLFIDAAHDYEGVKADIRRYVPRVARGGVVVFDDYKTHCRGVDKAVDRLLRTRRTWPYRRAANRLMIVTKR
jgi:predicted O-methyltransferase YrrM